MLLLLKGPNHISAHIFFYPVPALNFFLTIHDLIGIATKCQIIYLSCSYSSYPVQAWRLEQAVLLTLLLSGE